MKDEGFFFRNECAERELQAQRSALLPALYYIRTTGLEETTTEMQIKTPFGMLKFGWLKNIVLAELL